VTAEFEVFLFDREWMAIGDADLFADKVEPVIISVTGCSTWIRVFISMK